MTLHPSFSCFSFYLVFSFVTSLPLGTRSTSLTTPKDIINETCQKCANQSIILSYGLCSTSLPEIPVSHSANLEGLALVAMELALENVTSTLATIEKLLDSTSLDNFALGCLADCLELYSDAAWTIVNSVGVFLSGNYEVTRTWMSSVMEAASTCQQGFSERAEVSPLTQENYNLFQLCGIALCIIHMATPEAPFT
ncbi:putative invertase inhibitor [Cajanus cajan]|uniref:Invertase inhibitor n=1 Tax=Cajanus cajan TaxID=3821 RepID=A0A151R350_CAJCA|nr:putative invertase inhibitor [Cajanus cajan]KYP37018.1 Putative invertase inhibitor [Cajanus cajan]